MNLTTYADKIEKAALSVRHTHLFFPLFHACADEHAQTIAEGKSITGDLGGKSSTKEYTAAIIGKL